jgi:hypothetical protein
MHRCRTWYVCGWVRPRLRMFYNLSCNAVRDSSVSEEMIGEADFEGKMVLVHKLENGPSVRDDAVSLPGGLYAEGDQFLSESSMEFPQVPTQRLL